MNRWLLIAFNVLLLGIVLAAFPYAMHLRKPFTENNRGVEALNAKRYDEAIAVLKGAVSSKPENEVFRRNLLAAYNSQAIQMGRDGRNTEALTLYERALELDPKDGTLIRNYVSSLNNLAVEQSNLKQFTVAQQFFERASNMLTRLGDPKARDEIRHNYSALLTLWGAELMKRNQTEEAKLAFRQSLDLETSNAVAHVYMGDLGYEANDYQLAKKHYAAAIPLDDENREYLSNRLQMIEDELKVEGTFRRVVDPNGRFVVQYVEYANGVTVAEVVAILSEAYEVIGKELGVYPARAVNVKIYQPVDFAKIAKLPEWAIGIFDGKMRLKVDEIQSGRNQVRDLLFHEYTHAVLAMNVKQKVPAWFHEGVAQLMEPQFKENPREQAQMRDALAQNKVDFEHLQDSFKEITSKGDAENAYLLSKYFLTYLNRKFGQPKLTEWVKELTQDVSFEDAFKKVYGLPLPDAQQAWIKQQVKS